VFSPFRPAALRHLPPYRFEPLDPERSLRAVAPEQVRAWNERGYFVFEDLYSKDEIAELTTAIDTFVEKAQAHLRRMGGKLFISHADGIVFAPHLVARSAIARRYAAHPRLAALCLDLLGSDVRLYWDQAVYKYPAFPKEFPWHQDNGYTFVLPELYLTVWVALSDATPENGCVEVVPGSHRLGTLEHRAAEEGYFCHVGDDGARAPIRAGSALVFSSLTVHRTGPNRTRDDVRKSYILQYAPDGSMRYPRGGAPERCDVPERQFFVVRSGAPVPPPGLARA
jgi:ectoine hydroxylase-related dioxygenase (phytanoyl-CoA dioxygenase family)